MRSTSLIRLSSLWGVSRCSCYSAWVAMELNLVLLIPIIVCSSFSTAKFSRVKYLIIQRISGIIILIIFIVSNLSNINFFWVLLLNMFIILKLGAAPFYHWVLIIREGQGWWSIYLILTLQKVIPLYLTQLLGCKTLITLRALSILIMPFYIFRVKSLKKIIVLSSTYTLIAIISAILLIGYKWKTLLILYLISLTPLISINGFIAGRTLRPKILEDKTTLIVWVILVISLLGVPPLPGFLLKFDIRISLIYSNFWGISAVFNFMSGMLIYMYINIIILKVVYTPATFLPSTHIGISLKTITGLIIFVWFLF